jgi:hypothetical protein
MIDPQTIANGIRDHVVDHPIIRRLGIEVLWAAGTTERLTVRVRHRDQVLDVQRGVAWTRRDVAELGDELAHELVGEALGTRRPIVPASRWTRGSREPMQLLDSRMTRP